jgi:predicted peptidase
MKSTIVPLVFAVLVSFAPAALAADAPAASLKEGSLVTEVLSWGETVTAVRLEYTEEIYCGELAIISAALATDSGLPKFHLFADRPITNAYVNNSGNKGDVAVYGKYVFLELGLNNADQSTYRSQVTFNQSTKSRPKLAGYNVSQILPVTTRSGKVVAPVTIATTREICIGMDDYKTFTYKNEATGKTLNYHLYIPAGYETKGSQRNLPLVVHFPSGDYNIGDWTGKYRGAMFSHPDALYWSTKEAQAQNPSFVLTVGGAADPSWNGLEFAKSEMQQNYVKIIQKVMGDYNVDASRIYSISLAGGSVPMWSTILGNPKLFAAQISTSYDPYHAWKSAKVGEENFAALLKTLPGWFFAGAQDTTGLGILGAEDKRLKGERLRDVSAMANQNGANIEIGYGKDGELMWNGLLRGTPATRMAEEQIARAKAKGAKHLVTVYMPGTVVINQHWTWDAAYSNAAVRNWLFQQVGSK